MQRFLRLAARPLSRLAAALLVLLPVATPAENRAAPSARPALWKVADADTTIYLFGTVHVLPAGVDWYGGKVAEAFDSSQELVTEIIEPEDGAMQAMMLQRATLPANQSLRGLMSKDQRAKYEAALARLNFQPQTFDHLEPWSVGMGLTVISLARSGLVSENGVDRALAARAKERKLTHAAFETAEYQLDLFDSLSMETQKLYLAQVVKELPSMNDQIGKMVAAWKHGDAEELARLTNAGEDTPEFREAILTRRNLDWAGWIKRRMAKPGKVFVAVGAGHLAGPGSLQEQLAAQGIASERLQ